MSQPDKPPVIDAADREESKQSWVQKVSVVEEDGRHRLIESNRKVAKSLLRFDDVEVLFPFEQPYPCQVNMMESVV